VGPALGLFGGWGKGCPAVEADNYSYLKIVTKYNTWV